MESPRRDDFDEVIRRLEQARDLVQANRGHADSVPPDRRAKFEALIKDIHVELAQLETEEEERGFAEFEAETGMTEEFRNRWEELNIHRAIGTASDGYAIQLENGADFPPPLAPDVERPDWVMGEDHWPRAPWEIIDRFVLRVKERDLRGFGRGGPPREAEEWDIVRRVLKRKLPTSEAQS